MKNAEYFLSTTPVEDLFKDKPISHTTKKVKQVRDMDKGIKKRVDNFILSDKRAKPVDTKVNLSDFDTIKGYIQNDRDENMLEIQLSGIMDDELKDEFSVLSTAAINNLKTLLPVNRSETLFDVSDRDPSDYEKGKFIRQVRVLQEPSHVLDLVDSGEITGTEVDALSLFYPEYLGEIQKAIVEAMVDVRAKDDVNFGRKKNTILSTVLQVPRLTQETIQTYQDSYIEEEDEEKRKGMDLKTNPDVGLTEAQRVAMK